MPTNTVGIDPGLKGAIALIRDNGGISLVDIPTYQKQKKNWIHLEELFKILVAFKQQSGRVVIEKVHSMPNQGVSSVFKFGKGYGILLGMCTALGFDICLVPPNVWKKHFGLGRDKKQSIDLVNELYDVTIKPSKDGQAEALLIARYGREKCFK